MKRAGYVLVGGKSSRMGRDKALLPYGGRTLVEHIAARVEAAAGWAALVGQPERYGALGYPVIPDVFPEQGPLGGIQAALHASKAEWNLVVACDMPSLSVAFLNWLLEMAEGAPGHCLIPVSGSGQPEPLCAVYHCQVAETLTRAIQRRVRKVTQALEGLRVVWQPVSEAAWFENLNTPGDWAMHNRVALGGGQHESHA